MTALKAVTAPKGARRRMVTVAALAAGAAIALSGCSAGQISQTADQVAAVNGSYADVGSIALRNVHIVYPNEGGGYNNAKGGKALIALSIINNSASVPDELTSITTDLGTVKLTGPAGKSVVELAPRQTVVAASTPVKREAAPTTTSAAPTTGAGATTTAPRTTAPTTTADSHGGDQHGAQPATDPEAKPIQIEITGLTKDITPGLTYNVSFNFKQNGTVQVQVPVDAGLHTERHVSDKSGPAEAEHGSGSHGSGGH
ncbi:hypothetical protein [Nocardia asiatica]|uniref:hypothetical protein n=1 Tax=Nocardia asiatica TaxID=209252 RepID=UPI001FDF5792|nr:hypothetical protein [Nocardia asiatica]